MFQCWWLPCSLLSCWCSIFSVKNNPPAEPCNYVWLRYQYVFSVSAILSLYWKLFTNKLILLSREFIVNYCEIYQILDTMCWRIYKRIYKNVLENKTMLFSIEGSLHWLHIFPFKSRASSINAMLVQNQNKQKKHGSDFWLACL